MAVSSKKDVDLGGDVQQITESGKRTLTVAERRRKQAPPIDVIDRRDGISVSATRAAGVKTGTVRGKNRDCDEPSSIRLDDVSDGTSTGKRSQWQRGAR